ncbi:hypothetical protein SERLA73DRAFT_160028 [Serpula lacrymans var. lacrymans S7.3]|uniref:Plasma membrane fusion protein PRM1 n=2 Tax=Serpula lacrymans var. lacrymans TaxID=341189 RepID=F8PWC7_SERL3|nr:uncharacterized protein SERLADRAFT_415059 [Serpula lacrymans var. lacrymans S7.9]EGN99932.1 hypothetical protein SERLA73DRAFT_160028 [Serpula lacrymans var. lacrymans S7.3]EGO25501.1 hypothetical protein SERLADRAFT_415059 [Serpula lacrymans var. lacrymans S7.9]
MSLSSQPPRWMSPPPVYDARSSAQTSSTSLRPYLQLPHILSLTWLAYPILSLLFVIFRLQLSSSSAQAAVANAKGDLLTACQAAEQAATAAASMPRYMAIASNEQFADAVNGTMNGARAALILALTAMEAIINFLIDIYRSTFLCFLELVVTGGLALLISAVQDSTLNSIVSGLKNDATSLNSAIQTAVSAVNKVNPFGTIQAPQFNITSLDALSNITIPTTFENTLISLNNSLPTISSIKDSIQDLVDTPFEAVKADINNTFLGLSFDSSVLPVPEQNTLSFCTDLDTSSVDNLGQDLLSITKIGTIILIAIVLLLLAGHSALEWYKWRCLRQHLQNTREAWVSDPTLYHTGPTQSAPSVTLSDHNLLMLQVDSAHPLLTRIANFLSTRLRLSTTQHIHLRWFLHYIFHPPALACFLIGFFGLLSVQVQLIAIGPLEAKYSAQAAASVQDLSTTIASQVNNSMYNQSSTYASAINAKVDTVQATINNGVFGWVNGTTTTLNDTLNTFYSDVQNIVTTVFNGTILETPAQDFIKCIIGSKVTALEEALTFLNENLKVNIPTVNESVLVLSPSDVNDLTQPIATAAIGGGQNNSQGLIGRLVATYVDSLLLERIMFAIFIGLWGIVVLMGLSVVFWHSYGKDWVESYKKRRWQKEQRDGLGGFVVPFRDAQPANAPPRDEEKCMEKQEHMDLPAFTPLPESRSSLSIRAVRRSTEPGTNTNHPLTLLEPKFEKSWDSFHRDAEADSSQPSLLSRAISRPKKLMALSNIAPRDNTNSQFGGVVARPAEPPQTDGGWFKNFGGLFRKKDRPESELGSQGRTSPRRTRPQLTISTERAASLKQGDLPTVEVSSPDERPPVSAWSISPTPPSLPPLKNISPPKPPAKKPVPMGLPPAIRPTKRRNASVPTDVDSTYDDSTLLIPKHTRLEMAEKANPFAVAIHHAFEYHPSPPPVPSPAYRKYPSTLRGPTTYLLPPKEKHRRSSSVPGSRIMPPGLAQAPNNATNESQESTPVTRLLTTTHARHSSGAVDPFATPFDDEARVASSPGPLTARRSNPFAGFAL